MILADNPRFEGPDRDAGATRAVTSEQRQALGKPQDVEAHDLQVGTRHARVDCVPEMR